MTFCVFAMDDKTCRLEILQILKDHYDQEPLGITESGEILLKARGLEQNVLARNVKYLQEKGLVDASWTMAGTFTTWITAQGIDFLETGQPSRLAILSPLTVHQEFHGPVRAVAGRDINPDPKLSTLCITPMS